MVAPLPLSTHVALERMLEGAGLGEYMSETDRRQQNITGIRLSQESPVDWTPSATVQRSHMAYATMRLHVHLTWRRSSMPLVRR